jgi:hypothetical protein
MLFNILNDLLLNCAAICDPFVFRVTKSIFRPVKSIFIVLFDIFAGDKQVMSLTKLAVFCQRVGVVDRWWTGYANLTHWWTAGGQNKGLNFLHQPQAASLSY